MQENGIFTEEMQENGIFVITALACEKRKKSQIIVPFFLNWGLKTFLIAQSVFFFRDQTDLTDIKCNF